MKQKFLLLGAALMMSATVFAQWTKPVPSNTQDMVDDGATIQFLYNTGAGGFLAGANDYNTRASVAVFGKHWMALRMRKRLFRSEHGTLVAGLLLPRRHGSSFHAILGRLCG